MAGTERTARRLRRFATSRLGIATEAAVLSIGAGLIVANLPSSGPSLDTTPITRPTTAISVLENAFNPLATEIGKVQTRKGVVTVQSTSYRNDKQLHGDFLLPPKAPLEWRGFTIKGLDHTTCSADILISSAQADPTRSTLREILVQQTNRKKVVERVEADLFPSNPEVYVQTQRGVLDTLNQREYPPDAIFQTNPTRGNLQLRRDTLPFARNQAQTLYNSCFRPIYSKSGK